jgi:hypothetical protein
MYKNKDLYKLYKKYNNDDRMSRRFPDVTKRSTIEVINNAINLCDKWDNFLDIGASTGHYSTALLHKFRKGTAIEANHNEHLLDLLRVYQNFSVKLGFIQELDFDEKFDFILMADIFEHIPLIDMPSLLEKVSKVQDVGGVLYILTPNPIYCGPASESSIFHNRGKSDHEGHYKHYDRIEINKVMNKYKYEKIFDSYEEGKVKNFFKRYIFSISIRDKRYSRNPIYRVLSPHFIWIIKIFYYFVDVISYYFERKNRYNDFCNISYVGVFKKCE